MTDTRALMDSRSGQRGDARPAGPLALSRTGARGLVTDALHLIPVMVRGAGGHAPSGYRVFAEYETFDEAAAAVQALRRDPAVAWAYIPDEYAGTAR